MKALIAVAALLLVGCGPDFTPEVDACVPKCLSIQPPDRRDGPHCAPTADGGTACTCYEWSTC